MDAISQRIHDLHEETVATRRDFHMHPELAFEEVRTSQIVAERLRSLGLQVTTGIAKTGVMAVLHGGKPGPTLLIRADMDALPIEEANDVAYRSQIPGVMHACGHDAHTAIALSTARVLAEMQPVLPGTIKFVFQPAEERYGGAKPMIESGVLESPRVDAAIGLHVSSTLPTGQICAEAGSRYANTDSFTLTIRGRGGHGARPHTTVDPISVGFQVGSALQTLVSRETNPLHSAAVTIGSVHGGTVSNVIPMQMVFEGTVRTYDLELREQLRRRIKELAGGICGAMRAELDYVWHDGYPVLVNDDRVTAFVREAAHETVSPHHVVRTDPTMGGEDMAYFLREVPGCFFNLGTMNSDLETDFPHHHPRFDLDESALSTGVEVLVRSALRFLG